MVEGLRIGDDSSSYDAELQRIAQASGGSFRTFYEFSNDMQNFYSQIYRQMKEYYLIEYTTDSLADLNAQKEIQLYVENGDLGGECSVSMTPWQEMFENLLGAYLRSYIFDMNNHYYNRLYEYVDPNVAPDDKWSIQWQMQKQVSGGFDNVYSEDIMAYEVTRIEAVDADTVHLWATEDYDTIYSENYGDMLAGKKAINKTQLLFMNSKGYANGSIPSYATVRVWARVRQFPEYILKRGSDGRWRFSQYTGDLSLNQHQDFYNLETYY